MTDPRPPDEQPFTDAPLWNPKALRQEFLRYVREQLANAIEVDRTDGRELVKQYQWALEKLLAEGLVEVVRRQGNRTTFRVKV